MSRKTPSVAVRITKKDLDDLTELKRLIRETYIAAGVAPPDPITNAWAIRASIALHRRSLNGEHFTLPMNKFKARFFPAMIAFGLSVAEALGADTDGVEVVEDREAGTVAFHRPDSEPETVPLGNLAMADLPITATAVH